MSYDRSVYAGFLDLSHPLPWTIDGVLSSEECSEYIARFERGTPEIRDGHRRR